MPGRVARGLLVAGILALLSPALAAAHFERPGVFPDPASDTSVSPAAGGSIPSPRPGGRALVVCTPSSLERARRAGLRGSRLRRVQRLRKRCRFREVQGAVSAARNGDRVLILPGVYREPSSRARPTFDPKCKDLRVVGGEQSAGEEPQALSYAYQAECPNDQNLIAVIGRDPASGSCVRCNLQVEGLGRRPADVLIDAGKRGEAPGKDVGLRADRADGFQVRNLQVERAGEHGIYVIETDGYAIRRAIASDNGNYGFLTFVSDHGLHDRCEAYGNSNAGVYPGAAPDSAPRLNQVLRRCDSHDNVLGYSGTMGNSVLVEDSDFHGNTVGIATDSYLAAGHPGYPQDHAVFRGNRIYSNNLNPYVAGSKLKPSFPFPVGTGIFIAGGNDDLIEGNYIYDNWRRGTMLITVPGPVANPPQPSADATSHRNVQRGNRMGMAPDDKRLPNGVDFWWDEAGTGNCWEDNGRVTSDPSSLDACPGRPIGVPNVGNPAKQAILGSCATWPEDTSAACDWFETPPPPDSGNPAAASSRGRPVERLRETGVILRLCPPLGRFPCLVQAPLPAGAQRGGPRAVVPVNARQTCTEWNRSGRRDRRAVANALRGALAADLQFRGIAIVPERVALGHLNAACRQPIATGFSLWEVFTVHATWWAGAPRGHPGPD